MALPHRSELDPMTKVLLYLHNCINNKYFFTFEARGSPEGEEYGGELRFIQPYLAEFHPNCKLGRPVNQETLLPIPKLLHANCLDSDQYPWNVVCSGDDGLEWDVLRQSFYKALNLDAYKAERSKIFNPIAPQSAMSTITPLAQQSSYP